MMLGQAPFQHDDFLQDILVLSVSRPPCLVFRWSKSHDLTHDFTTEWRLATEDPSKPAGRLLLGYI